MAFVPIVTHLTLHTSIYGTTIAYKGIAPN